MDPRISIITLGVEDFQTAYRFYKKGLGFQTKNGPDDQIAFFQLRGIVLAIYPLEKLAEDIAPDVPGEKPKFSGTTLAHNVMKKEEVDSLLAKAEAAGGRIVKPGQNTFWGGYSGYFADPEGYYWEVAYFDKWQYDQEGHLVL
ncbi:MAG: VOC family protein [Spirochaetia bacterium]